MQACAKLRRPDRAQTNTVMEAHFGAKRSRNFGG
jgi:hypothetical protein